MDDDVVTLWEICERSCKGCREGCRVLACLRGDLEQVGGLAAGVRNDALLDERQELLDDVLAVAFRGRRAQLSPSAYPWLEAVHRSLRVARSTRLVALALSHRDDVSSE